MIQESNRSRLEHAPEQRGHDDSKEPILPFDLEAERRQEERPCGTPQPVSDLAQQLEQVGAEIRQCRHALSEIGATFGELKVQDTVLAQMHEECRGLREQFHEREVLKPLFGALIRIADRCRQEIARQRGSLAHGAENCAPDIEIGLRSLLRARKADLVEIEACLATFGVLPFRCHDARFNPAFQLCTKPVPTNDPELVDRIATRLLPGYRRDGSIMRSECVNVFVVTHAKKKEVTRDDRN